MLTAYCGDEHDLAPPFTGVIYELVSLDFVVWCRCVYCWISRAARLRFFFSVNENYD
jgi:hypothetical protein